MLSSVESVSPFPRLPTLHTFHPSKEIMGGTTFVSEIELLLDRQIGVHILSLLADQTARINHDLMLYPRTIRQVYYLAIHHCISTIARAHDS